MTPVGGCRLAECLYSHFEFCFEQSGHSLLEPVGVLSCCFCYYYYYYLVVAKAVVVVLFWTSIRSFDPCFSPVGHHLVFFGHGWSLDFGNAAVAVDLCWSSADHGHDDHHHRGSDRDHHVLNHHDHGHFGSGQLNHLHETSGGCCAEGGHHLLLLPSLDDAAGTGCGDLIWRMSTPVNRRTLCGPSCSVLGCKAKRATRRVA